MDADMYLSLVVVVLTWVVETVVGQCLPALGLCGSYDDVMLNCIDVSSACLAINRTFRVVDPNGGLFVQEVNMSLFAVLSNFTKDLQFHGGATVRVLDVETQKQFDEFCTVNYIESVHYEDQLCIKHGITVSEVIIKPSTPPTQPEDIETINDFIGYIVWGGVACGILVAFLVAVVALMLRRKR